MPHEQQDRLAERRKELRRRERGLRTDEERVADELAAAAIAGATCDQLSARRRAIRDELDAVTLGIARLDAVLGASRELQLPRLIPELSAR